MLEVAPARRKGVPIVGTAVFIRTCQHTDGWTDLPKSRQYLRSHQLTRPGSLPHA